MGIQTQKMVLHLTMRKQGLNAQRFSLANPYQHINLTLYFNVILKITLLRS